MDEKLVVLDGTELWVEYQLDTDNSGDGSRKYEYTVVLIDAINDIDASHFKPEFVEKVKDKLLESEE